MADSTIATKDIENWIRSEFLPRKYHQAFAKRKLALQFRPALRRGTRSGGEFKCDAVSEDGMINCFLLSSLSSKKKKMDVSRNTLKRC
jgi:hypothetical protein